MNFDQPAKLVISLGIILVVIGIVMSLGGRFNFGRLPGDIIIKRENFTFYFPVVTCIVVSGLFTLIMWIIRAVSRR